jgi:hypothetical protein
MRALREMLHRDAKLIPSVLEFIRSGKQPLSARVLAVFSTAGPASQELVLFHCSILDDPPDVNLAQAVLFGYYIARGGEQEHEWWGDLMEVMPYFGCSKNYSPPQSAFGDMRGQLLFRFDEAPQGVNYLPLLRSLVGFLEKEKHASLRYRIEMASNLVRQMDVRGPERIRFAKLVEKTYLDGGEGWRSALEALADRSGHCGPDQFEILGRGLARLDGKRKTDVLGEVARNWGVEVFRPPFRDCLEEVIDYMGKQRTQNEPMTGCEWSICAILIRQSLDATWAERLLIKSPSATLRRKSAMVLQNLCQTTDRFEWKRYARLLERMIGDPDTEVRHFAIGTLQEALSRKAPPFEAVRAEELRRHVPEKK